MTNEQIVQELEQELASQTEAYEDCLLHGDKRDDAHEHWIERQEGVLRLIREQQESIALLTELRDAAIAGQETLQQYINRVSALPDCNTCRFKYSNPSCEHLPPPGAFARINCPLWRSRKRSDV